MGKIVKVGLTGGIATGKSTVARILEDRLGVPVINSDQIARDVVKKGRVGYKRVVEVFGHGILDNSGEIDRAKLGKLVFDDPQKRRLLESILHPLITQEIDRRLKEKEQEDHKLIVLEIPLLFEKGLQNRVDYTVVVYAPEEQQLERLMQRDGLSLEEAKKRLKAQIPIDEKVKLADFVIDNSKGVNYTEKQTLKVFNEILRNASR